MPYRFPYGTVAGLDGCIRAEIQTSGGPALWQDPKGLNPSANIKVMIYFAYGSNMNSGQMHYRCRGNAFYQGNAISDGFRFMINSSGVATIVEDNSSIVRGVLWEISGQCERILNKEEGVKNGVYLRRFVQTKHENGELLQALVYIASNKKPGNPRAGYMEKIIEGAGEHGLLGEYIDWLSDSIARPR